MLRMEESVFCDHHTNSFPRKLVHINKNLCYHLNGFISDSLLHISFRFLIKKQDHIIKTIVICGNKVSSLGFLRSIYFII